MLVGNGVRLSSNPMRLTGGQHVLNDAAGLGNRSCAGSLRNQQQAFGTRAATPDGYRPPYSWTLAQKNGAVSARNQTTITITPSATGVKGLGGASEVAAEVTATATGNRIVTTLTISTTSAEVSASGAISGGRSGTGSATASLTATATGLLAGPLSGTVALATSHAATLSAGMSAAGSASVSVSASATMQTIGVMAAGAALSVSVTGVAVKGVNLSASDAVTMSASLTTYGNGWMEADAEVELTGSLATHGYGWMAGSNVGAEEELTAAAVSAAVSSALTAYEAAKAGEGLTVDQSAMLEALHELAALDIGVPRTETLTGRTVGTKRWVKTGDGVMSRTIERVA